MKRYAFLAVLATAAGCCDGQKLTDSQATTGAGSSTTTSASPGSSTGAARVQPTSSGSTSGTSSGSTSSAGSTSGTSAGSTSGSTGSAPACAATAGFSSQAMFPTEAQPAWLGTGDFNGDGWPDLVTSGSGAGMDILLNNGDGTFAAPVAYPSGSLPEGNTVADLNGDGLPDVVVVNNDDDGPGSLAVFLNAAGDGFAPPALYPTGSAPFNVVAGDLNGDGHPDLVGDCTGYLGETAIDAGVAVFLSHGDGTFGPVAIYPVAQPFPSSPVIADFTGDGISDVVVVHDVSSLPNEPELMGTIGLLPGRGDGTLGPETLTPVAQELGGITVGDFNSDGRPDIAVGTGGLSTTFYVLLGQDGGFGLPLAYTAGSEPVSLTTAALGGALPDLVIANTNDGTLGVLRNNGAGGFGPQTAYAVGTSGADTIPESPVVADFNRDGLPDLACADNQDNAVSVLFGCK